MGAESEKGGQGQCFRSSQSHAERVSRVEGVAEPGKPQPGSAFSGRGVAGEEDQEEEPRSLSRGTRLAPRALQGEARLQFF